MAKGHVLKAGQWTPEEDQALYEWQGKLGNRWSEIARHIPNRSGQQCAQRWRHKVNPNIVRDKWTEEEDSALVQLVNQLGHHWAKIARHIPGRTDQQCLGRWRRHLDPSVRRGAWRPEEDTQLLLLHARYGNAWSHISKLLLARTPQQCRARFYKLVPKADQVGDSSESEEAEYEECKEEDAHYLSELATTNLYGLHTVSAAQQPSLLSVMTDSMRSHATPLGQRGASGTVAAGATQATSLEGVDSARLAGTGFTTVGRHTVRLTTRPRTTIFRPRLSTLRYPRRTPSPAALPRARPHSSHIVASMAAVNEEIVKEERVEGSTSTPQGLRPDGAGPSCPDELAAACGVSADLGTPCMDPTIRAALAALADLSGSGGTAAAAALFVSPPWAQDGHGCTPGSDPMLRLLCSPTMALLNDELLGAVDHIAPANLSKALEEAAVEEEHAIASASVAAELAPALPSDVLPTIPAAPGGHACTQTGTLLTPKPTLLTPVPGGLAAQAVAAGLLSPTSTTVTAWSDVSALSWSSFKDLGLGLISAQDAAVFASVLAGPSSSCDQTPASRLLPDGIPLPDTLASALAATAAPAVHDAGAVASRRGSLDMPGGSTPMSGKAGSFAPCASPLPNIQQGGVAGIGSSSKLRGTSSGKRHARHMHNASWPGAYPGEYYVEHGEEVGMPEPKLPKSAGPKLVGGRVARRLDTHEAWGSLSAPVSPAPATHKLYADFAALAAAAGASPADLSPAVTLAYGQRARQPDNSPSKKLKTGVHKHAMMEVPGASSCAAAQAGYPGFGPLGRTRSLLSGFMEEGAAGIGSQAGAEQGVAHMPRALLHPPWAQQAQLGTPCSLARATASPVHATAQPHHARAASLAVLPSAFALSAGQTAAGADAGKRACTHSAVLRSQLSAPSSSCGGGAGASQHRPSVAAAAATSHTMRFLSAEYLHIRPPGAGATAQATTAHAAAAAAFKQRVSANGHGPVAAGPVCSILSLASRRGRHTESVHVGQAVAGLQAGLQPPLPPPPRAPTPLEGSGANDMLVGQHAAQPTASESARQSSMKPAPGRTPKCAGPGLPYPSILHLAASGAPPPSEHPPAIMAQVGH